VLQTAMLRPASREDVVECYRAVLGRAPEDGYVPDGHLVGRPLVRDVVAKLAMSGELKARLLRSNVAFERAREPDYLAKSFDDSQRVQAYFGHYGHLVDALSDEGLLALITGHATLYRHRTTRADYRVALTATHDRHEEGELQLQFFRQDALIYVMQVTIVPGRLLGLADDRAFLISRMQGAPGAFLEIRQATKDLGEIDPKAALFAALEGIADALGIAAIVGVAGVNQLAYDEGRAETFLRHYDAFFTAAGGERRGDRFFLMAAGRTRKAAVSASRSHAKRATRKRRRKGEIAAAVAFETRTWLRTPSAPGPSAEAPRAFIPSEPAMVET
jgi:uncharacterized protein VirK/YbjX